MDDRFDSYFTGINAPNFKNKSQGVSGIMSGGGAGGTLDDSRLPQLNVSKKEQMEN